ncbi:MAG: hypothetical protein SPL50_03120 [Alloprevotella sp.]|nr:hypothetical protein [Alloprevotella sp.]
MKRYLLSLLVAFAAVLPMKALDYESARQQAWFLTDKMAYELNLTSEQYDRAYQINLDYFLNVNNPSDADGYYWNWRNEDLRYVLFDWQYRLYNTIDYFLRPIRWAGYRWYYPILNRYRYGYYYFSRPAIYLSYRGGFGHRHHHGGVSPYHGMHFHHGPGMRDTHRPPKKGWGEGRNFHNDNRGHNRHDGGYNPGNRPGGSHGGNHSGDRNPDHRKDGQPGGSHNNGGGHGGSHGNGSFSGGGNHGGSHGNGSFSGGGNHGGGNHSAPVTSPQNNSRPGGSVGSGGFGRSGNRGGFSGSSRSTTSRPSGNSSTGSRNNNSGSRSSGRHFGR